MVCTEVVYEPFFCFHKNIEHKHTIYVCICLLMMIMGKCLAKRSMMFN